MDTDLIRKLIANDQLQEAIDELRAATHGFPGPLQRQIINLNGRLSRIKKDNRDNLISRENFILERNILRNDILEFVDSVKNIHFNNPETGPENDGPEALEKFNELVREYETFRQIQNTFTRLRLIENTTRKLAEMIPLFPEVLANYDPPLPEAILVGIAKKIKAAPYPDDLDELEKLAGQARSNFSKGNIVNALAEIVYAGHLLIGDDRRIQQLLDSLSEGADIPLQKNIERVRAALEYMVGILPRKS